MGPHRQWFTITEEGKGYRGTFDGSRQITFVVESIEDVERVAKQVRWDTFNEWKKRPIQPVSERTKR